MEKPNLETYSADLLKMAAVLDFFLIVVLWFASAGVFMLGMNWFVMPVIDRAALGYFPAFGMLIVMRIAAMGFKRRQRDRVTCLEGLGETCASFGALAVVWLALYLMSRGI